MMEVVMLRLVRLVLALGFINIVPQTLGAQVEEVGPGSVYSFNEYLGEAEVFILSEIPSERSYEGPTLEKKMGRWVGDRFIFPDFENEYPVTIAAYNYNRFEEKGIFFHPSPDAVKVLRFFQVPTGSQMILYYGIDDIGAAFEEEATVYLNVWVGEHKVKRLRVPNEKGWKKEVIDLGVLSFLKRDTIVTFEVMADNEQDRRFSFLAEIWA